MLRSTSIFNNRAVVVLSVSLLSVLYAVVFLARADLDIFTFLTFLLWVVLVVFPSGAVCCRLIYKDACKDYGIIYKMGLGILLLPVVTSVLSLVMPGVFSLRFTLILFSMFVLLGAAKSLRHERSVLPDAMCILSLFMLVLHIMMLPDVFSCVDRTGSLKVCALGADSIYMTLGQQIARLGKLVENPWYAGMPFFRHHFFSEYLVASYLLTFGRNADIYQARLLFHFVLGLPLLFGFVCLVLRRLCRSDFWSFLVMLCLILPVTSYHFRGGWSGLEGMNGFWVMGIHADMNYLFGLIVFLLLVLLFLRYFEGPFMVRSLVGLQVMMVLATQFKANFSMVYYPAMQLVLLWYLARQRKYRLVGVVLVSSLLSVGCLVVWLNVISQGFAGRSFGLEYGVVALDSFLPLLELSRPDGVAPFMTLVEYAPDILKPIVVVFVYAHIYMPLVALVPVIIVLFASPGLRKRFDAFFLLTVACSIFAALFLIEASEWKWNLAGHLHYLIPVFGIFAAARLIGSDTKWPKLLAQCSVSLLLFLGVASMVLGARCFTAPLSYGGRVNRAFVLLCREIADTAPSDAVVLVAGELGKWEDRQMALLVDRSRYYSDHFVYNTEYSDYQKRIEIREAMSKVSCPDDAIKVIKERGLTLGNRNIYVIGDCEEKTGGDAVAVRRFGSYWYVKADG